jgi:hypothetical protein
MSTDKPLLVVRGDDPSRILVARMIGGFGLALLVAGTAGGGSLLFPALGHSFISEPRAWRLLVLPGALGAYLAERFVRPRAGSVAFYDARIVISKLKRKGALRLGKAVEHTEQLLWSELRGFRDHRSDHVVLVSESGSASFLTVPTLREEDRVQVLKLLDDHGIPRVE